MSIYAICLVKNEDDIVAQTLTHAARYCERIFVIDNGSTDETWDIVERLAGTHEQIVAFMRYTARYDEGLRYFAYEAHHRSRSEEDWWLVLDGDEFLAEDPQPLVRNATKAGADIINAWQIQFYYTEKDLAAWEAGLDKRELPISARRRFYRIDWQEPRLFRNQRRPEVIFRQSKLLTGECSWGAAVSRHRGRVWGRRILNRHYQYRDPPQIEKRLRLRYGYPEFAAQVKSLDWKGVMRPSHALQYHCDGEGWRFSASGLATIYAGRSRYILRSGYERLRSRIVALAGGGRRFVE